MNNSSLIRTTSFSLWTMGHRRYYSPMLQAAGRLPATETMVTPRVRPSLVLRRVREPGLDGGTHAPASGEKNRH
ncbi:MAG TPA: hypothetical protein VFC28_10095 [Opitutaceae bacterium]|jgi:hypothetical protein|nr:hypothetical protein [Opitutaceae bacterium]